VFEIHLLMLTGSRLLLLGEKRCGEKKGIENHPTHKQGRKSSDLTSNPKLFSTREVLDVFRRLVLHDEGREPRLDQLIARVLGNIWRDTDPERKIFKKRQGDSREEMKRHDDAFSFLSADPPRQHSRPLRPKLLYESCSRLSLPGRLVRVT